MSEQTFTRWGVGSVRSLHPDDVPNQGVIRAYNTALLPLIGGDSQVTTRPGFRQWNRAAVQSTAQIVGMVQFIFPGGWVDPKPTVIAAIQENPSEQVDAVSLWSITTASALTASVTTGVTTTWNISTSQPSIDFAVAKDRVYAVGMNFTPAVIWADSATEVTATIIQVIGMTAPANAPTVAYTEDTGSMTGTYEFAVTWYNEDFGSESSLSQAISTASSSTSATITVALNNTSIPVGVTQWRLYIRKPDISVKFQRLAEWSTSTATTTFDIDVSDDDINGMILQAPTVTENNQPPTGLRCIVWHQGRMFASDGEDLYYSNLENPEGWDPQNVEYIASGDGQKIVGLMPLDEASLAVFKTNSIYIIAGTSPQTWEVRKAPGNVGPSGVDAYNVAYGDGLVAFWGRNGMYLWDLQSAPLDITNEVWKEIYSAVAPSMTEHSGRVYFDPQGHRFLFIPHLTSALPGFGSATAVALPFSTIHRCWEATWWTGPGVDSLAFGQSGCLGSWGSQEDSRLFMAGSAGRILELSHDVWTDGAFFAGSVANTTGSGLTYTVSTATTTTIVVSDWVTEDIVPPASPYNSVLSVIDNTLGTVHRSPYTYSTAGGVLTFTLTNTASVAPSAGSIVVLDMPVMELDTRSIGVFAKNPETLADDLMRKKRYGRVYMDVAASGDCKFVLAAIRDAETTAVRVWTPVIMKNTVRDLLTTQPAAISGAERGWQGRIGAIAWRLHLRVIGWYPAVRWGLRMLGVDVKGVR